MNLDRMNTSERNTVFRQTLGIKIMTNFEQCQNLVAKQAFTMKVPGQRGRAVSVKVGDKFWVTTPTYSNVSVAKIERKGKGSISSGYQMDVSTIQSLFEAVVE